MLNTGGLDKTVGAHNLAKLGVGPSDHAQRAHPSHGWGHRFNPCRAHHQTPQKSLVFAASANPSNGNSQSNIAGTGRSDWHVIDTYVPGMFRARASRDSLEPLMRITLDSTPVIVEVDDGVMARRWAGATDTGIPVVAYVVAISPQTHDEAASARERSTSAIMGSMSSPNRASTRAALARTGASSPATSTARRPNRCRSARLSPGSSARAIEVAP
jgi:hypothetical protein